MDPFVGLLAAIIGYLAGAVSFARIVAHYVAPKRDITAYQAKVPGSQHTVQMNAISGTTVGMQLGAKWGGMVAILDILKVAIPALVFRLIYPGEYYHLILGTTGLLGHNWPIYYRFKGGRGLSPIYGGLLVADWLGALVTSVLAMFLGMVVLRIIQICYLGGLFLMIPWMILRGHPWPYTAYILAVDIIFVLALIPELKQTMELRRRMAEDGEALPGLGADEASPQGRMMTAVARRMGFIKAEEAVSEPPSDRVEPH